MAEQHLELGSAVALPKEEFDGLLANLRQAGYETIGPHVQNESIAYGNLSGLEDLPKGYLSEQEAGRYRLTYTGHRNYFDITPGPDTWKQFLFPPRSAIFTIRRNDNGWQIDEEKRRPTRYAFIGVRPCELAAIQVQDRVFMRTDWSDPAYRMRRQGIFLLNVNCLHPCDTCFCDSMGTGPQAQAGFDLSMTELEDIFLVEVASEAGRAVVQDLSWEPASAFWQQAAQRAITEARHQMKRNIPKVAEVPGLLLNNLDHPEWEDVGNRCLGCTNCTQVCPTCFCWDVKDITDLTGNETQRVRVWDSCFNPDYSYVFGGNSRPNIRARYRQWLTHKFASWVNQFGVSGCVGCGRCITWCPAAIDVTAEIAAIREGTNS
jgi:sulfhydrogenase subunit beta (sulfur reductase)